MITFLKDLITIFYILLFKFFIQYEFTNKSKRLAITLNPSFMNLKLPSGKKNFQELSTQQYKKSEEFVTNIRNVKRK